jgi:hypothetical protein
LEILPLRFSQGDGFAKPTVTKLTAPANGFSHIFIYKNVAKASLIDYHTIPLAEAQRE